MAEENRSAGSRIDEARTTDRQWREALALRLHRRLATLRRYDRAIQGLGIGISAILLLSVLTMAFRSSSAGLNVNLFIGMTFAAVATSMGALALVGVLTWLQKLTQRWITRLGLNEELEPLAAPEPRPPAPAPAWICSACWNENPGEAKACRKCEREMPVGESQLRVQLQKHAIHFVGFMIPVVKRKLVALVFALLLYWVAEYLTNR